MKHYESLIIGHITMDHDTDYLGNETLAIGGGYILHHVRVVMHYG